MYRQKITLILFFLLCIPAFSAAGRTLSLDSCRTLAVENNKDLQRTEMMKDEAYYNRKSAFTAYLPKVSLTGMYMRTGKELSLLSDEQKSALSGLGDALSMPALNNAGQQLVDALRTDTRNMSGAAVMLTQPLFMGGKIRAYNNITRFAEKIAADKHNLMFQETVVAVDETYWSIVELSARRRLAESYFTLVSTLDGNLTQLIAEGMATKADGLSVKVKVNEAKVAIVQVDNGLEILRMRMCQLCGLPLGSEISLSDENDEGSDIFSNNGDYADSCVWQSRPELSALGSAVRIYDEKVKVARSEFLPSVVLTGGYMASNPSVFNSFEKKFKGIWSVGVAVSIPVITWGDRVYKVRAAEARAAAARFEFEETREKIELQVSQCRQKLREAHERYTVSASSQAEADENLRYASLGFEEGVIPVSNVIEAQTAWLAAKTGLISSEIEIRLADVYLRKSLGIIR